jgi:hypothetical protein
MELTQGQHHVEKILQSHVLLQHVNSEQMHLHINVMLVVYDELSKKQQTKVFTNKMKITLCFSIFWQRYWSEKMILYSLGDY